MYKVFFYLLLNFSVIQYSISQCVNEVNAFKPGEKLYYDAYYNWGFIWIHAGDILFSVNAKTYNSNEVFYFKATGNSLKSYDWMYKVRDTFQSLADLNTLQPLWFERSTLEGGYKAYEKYIFNTSEKLIYSETETSKRKFKKDTIKSKPCTFDVLTAIYYCRSIPIEKYKVDEKIPVNAIIDNMQYPLYLRYKGKETIKTRENIIYKCIKFSVLLVEGTIFKGGEDMTIWVTDDENRVPVLVEAKILIGAVKAYLIKTEGLKNRITSLVQGVK